jgi:predicted DNA-binding transcriptional regulator AlpA
MGSGAAPAATPRWIGISELERRLGVSRCSIWRWSRLGTFPIPAKFGSRRAWKESAIEEWEAERSGQPPEGA